MASSRGEQRSAQRTSLRLNLIPCEWDKEFATRRPDLDYSRENIPYITTRGLNENVVRTFMLDPDESDVCSPQTDIVEAYCAGASLEALGADEGEANEQLVAYLDEMEFEEGGAPGRQRPYQGPLTAGGLYRELKKPRFRCGDSNSSRNSDAIFRVKQGVTASLGNLTESAPSENRQQNRENEKREEVPDADRRLIFITALDRWTIYSLIGTTSDWLAPSLRTTIYNHLGFENFIGVTFPPKGIAIFQLAFHLPYYVWRESPKAREDYRRDVKGRPLRKSHDVSFLDWTSSGPSSFLYEAQISGLVAGTDETRWTAYAFVDNYFDIEGEGKETVASYHEDSLDMEGGMLMDPLTLGTCAVDMPIWNPKSYFLVVFRVRLGQIKCEWQKLVRKFKDSIREYAPDYSLSLSGDRPSSKEALKHDDKVRRSRNWIVKVRMLSKLLSMELSKTVNACEKFCVHDSVYFQDQTKPVNGYRSLPAIQIILGELESQKVALECLAEQCDYFARELETQISLENNQVSILQQKITQDSKWLSVVMMSSLPVALTAGIFSMDQNVIPFLPASFGSFIGLIFTFSILGFVIVIHFVPSYHIRCWQLVGDLAWPKLWKKRAKFPEIAWLGFTRYWLFGFPTMLSDEERPPGEQAPG